MLGGQDLARSSSSLWTEWVDDVNRYISACSFPVDEPIDTRSTRDVRWILWLWSSGGLLPRFEIFKRQTQSYEFTKLSCRAAEFSRDVTTVASGGERRGGSRFKPWRHFAGSVGEE